MGDRLEEPHITSTLRWEEVTLPSWVTVDDLDAAILSALHSTWRKTARIVGDVVTAANGRSQPVDAEVIGARIRALAEAGRIESQGNLSTWRHSEVRLTTAGDARALSRSR